MSLTINEIQSIIACKDIDNNDQVSRFSIDSRNISKGDVFIAIKGERTDGHLYVEDVLKKGAVLAIVENEKFKSDNINIIKVDDCVEALGKLANYYIKKNKFKVIGITGSIGKTTTKDAIAAVLSSKFTVSKSIGNYNTEIGLPLSVLNANQDSEYLILEMGARKIGDIKYLCNIAPLDIAVITQIAPVHLEIFKSMEGIIKAKSEIIENIKEVAFLNGDDINLKKIGERFGKIIYFGCKEQEVEKVVYNEKGTYVEFKDYTISIPLPGKGGLYALLCAKKIAEHIGIDKKIIKKTLKEFKSPERRIKIINKGDLIIIDDSYNSSPVALSSAFNISKKIKARRYIAVLGDMKELGEDTEYYHKFAGLEVYNMEFDLLFCVGEYCEYIKTGAVNAGMEKNKIKTGHLWEDIYPFLESILLKGDLVLVKGSRAISLDKLVKKILLKEQKKE